MRILYLFVIVCVMSFSARCFAQISDDFSKMDTLWCGETEKFAVSNGQLQLNAPSAGSAAMAIPCQIKADTMEWQWWVKLAFSPWQYP